MFKYLGAAVAGAILMAATSASAALITGGFNVTGAMTPSSDPFMMGSTVTLGPAGQVEATANGDFAGLPAYNPVNLSAVVFTIDTAANAGLTFSIDGFTFEVLKTTDASVPFPFGLVNANILITGAGFDPTLGFLALAANNLEDGYTMGIRSLDEAPAVPVPAALPLMAGAIGLLGFLRRRAA